MAKESLQDKFQTSYPYPQNDENEDKWTKWEWPPNRAMRTRPIRGGYSDGLISQFSLGPKGSQRMEPWSKNQFMENETFRTGMTAPVHVTDLQERVVKENGTMKLRTASQSDVTPIVNDERNLLTNGFALHDMDSVDDQYTGENQDHFYGIVYGPDDAGNDYEGFVERNNYLDRLLIAYISVIPFMFMANDIRSWFA